MRIRGVFVLCSCLLLLGSHAGAQVRPVRAPDPAKAALIEELIVALKAEQQQQVMQTMQTAIQNQVNQAVDAQLNTLGNGSQADVE